MIGLPDLVFAVPAFGQTRDDFMEELGHVFESLGMAFEELRDLQRRSAAGAPALDLNRSYANLYGLLWQAYKDRFQKAMRALGVNIASSSRTMRGSRRAPPLSSNATRSSPTSLT